MCNSRDLLEGGAEVANVSLGGNRRSREEVCNMSRLLSRKTESIQFVCNKRRRRSHVKLGSSGKLKYAPGTSQCVLHRETGLRQLCHRLGGVSGRSGGE